MQYSQLPKQAQRFIRPEGLPEQLRLATKNHYVCRGLAILGLLPLLSSLLMAVTLDGAQQTVYQFVVVLLLPVLLILGTLKHHLVLDNPSKQRFVQLQIFGYHCQKAYQAPLPSTELLLRHSSYDRSQYELKLDNIVYPIVSLVDATQVTMFFASTFNIPAKEQVSNFPHIHNLIASSTETPLETSSKLNKTNNQSIPDANTTFNKQTTKPQNSPTTKDNDNTGKNKQAAPFVAPLWQPKVIIRIFYPLPFLMLFGFIMKYLGTL